MKAKAAKPQNSPNYAQYGLDTVKRSQDKKETGAEFYDPWTWQTVRGRNFYLCFSNWVISQTTIDAFVQQEPMPVLENDSCIKCKAKDDRPLHYQIAGEPKGGIEIGICTECVRWAQEYMSKPPPPPPIGTQFTIF